MGWTSSRRRRVGITVAVLLPLGILIQGLSQVGAQFPNGGPPKPPGFNPPGGIPPGVGKPPGFNPPMGPKFPGGPTTIVYDWRCSKCNKIIATTTSPFKPGVDSCPNCGVHFINGGKSFLNPPANLPPANMPPANMPPGGLAPPNGAAPGFAPPNGGPPGFVPPNGAPPDFPPPNGPPAGFVPPNNPVAPPMDFAPPMPPPANFQPPVIAMDNNPPVQVAAANDCRWCSAQLEPGQRYCGFCKFIMGAVIVGGTFVLVVIMVPLVLLFVYVCRFIGIDLQDVVPFVNPLAVIGRRK